MSVDPARDAGALFDAGSRAGRVMKARDWSATALGPVDEWPESLKTALRLMLASPVATFIWWGRDLLNLHNDACAELFGRRRPDARAIGRPASEVRQDIWSALGPEVVEVMAENVAARVSERPLIVKRNGRDREIYCSFALTPIRDEWGNSVGVLGVCTDETAHVLARRRLAALRGLPPPGKADGVKAASEWAAAALAANVQDVPFALIYLVDDDGERARLAGSAGRLPEQVAASLPVGESEGPWPLAGLGEGDIRHIEKLPAGFPPGAGGGAVLTLGAAGAKRPEGYLILGVNGRLPFDTEYRGFVGTAAGLIGAGISSARLRERSDAGKDPGTSADAQRNRFLAMLAHELRNPLAPIRSAVELLSYVDRNPMSLTHAREIIERQLTQLVRLIDDLLDVSRISRGTMELRQTPLDLRTTIASAVESVRPLIDEARHELAVRMPEDPVNVHGDHVRLSQAVANLLMNSSQYTEDGGHIAVSVECPGDTALVRVTDDGVGITEAMLPGVFDMFSQGEQRRDQPRRGLGIGLTIARTLVELHGGTITARSAGRGRGSEFLVSLPLLRLGSRSAAGGTPSLASAAARRILVADDNTDAAVAMAEILGMIGHDVRTAEDGVEAVELAESFRPDLILLDIGMPRADGYEACRRIRQRAWGRHVAIYAVTGWGQASDRRRTREAGFNAHLVKPVSIAAIQELIARREH